MKRMLLAGLLATTALAAFAATKIDDKKAKKADCAGCCGKTCAPDAKGEAKTDAKAEAKTDAKTDAPKK